MAHTELSPSLRINRLRIASSFHLSFLYNKSKSLLLLLKHPPKIHYKATVFCESNPAHCQGSSSLLSPPRCQIQRPPFLGSTKSLLSPHLSAKKITAAELFCKAGSEVMRSEGDIAIREWIVSSVLKA